MWYDLCRWGELVVHCSLILESLGGRGRAGALVCLAALESGFLNKHLLTHSAHPGNTMYLVRTPLKSWPVNRCQVRAGTLLGRWGGSTAKPPVK